MSNIPSAVERLKAGDHPSALFFPSLHEPLARDWTRHIDIGPELVDILGAMSAALEHWEHIDPITGDAEDLAIAMDNLSFAAEALAAKIVGDAAVKGEEHE